MFDQRRYLGTFAVFALVLLRIVVGWHFFREGTDKVTYDRHDGELRMKFSASGFLSGAKGPLAKLYLSNTPEGHGWRELLATPKQNVQPTEAEATERANWQYDYDQRRAVARDKKEPQPVEFAPSAAYKDWAERIQNDWRTVVADFKDIPAVTEEQEKKADGALNDRLQKLVNYLALQTEAIAEYRHELWRLENWRKSPEAGNVPFVDDRIATKTGDTAKTPTTWVSQIAEFDADLRNDLSALLTEEQRGQALTTSAVNGALADHGQVRLERVNVIVTILTLAVGVCLLLGLFTRLAAIIGALFLLGVILSQPPWMAESIDTMPQVIEFAATLVLAGTGAGRWLGLDAIAYGLFHRNRHLQIVETR